MPQAVTDSRGTLFDQPLRLESDGMEEPMIPGCVSIANCHEHTAGEVPFLLELSKGMLGVGRIAGNLFSNTRWMTGGHHLLERVASLRREMLGSDLSVQALAGL